MSILAPDVAAVLVSYVYQLGSSNTNPNSMAINYLDPNGGATIPLAYTYTKDFNAPAGGYLIYNGIKYQIRIEPPDQVVYDVSWTIGLNNYSLSFKANPFSSAPPPYTVTIYNYSVIVPSNAFKNISSTTPYKIQLTPPYKVQGPSSVVRTETRTYFKKKDDHCHKHSRKGHH